MFSSTYIPNMKAFPFFIPEKKRQIGFETKITVTHRFSCFASCQPHLLLVFQGCMEGLHGGALQIQIHLRILCQEHAWADVRVGFPRPPWWCSPDTDSSSNFMPRTSTLLAWADVRVGFPSALMRVVALMAFFCSIHSFLCKCGDRMERLDRHLTSEGCNTFSMAKTSGKAQCAPYYKNTITYSTSIISPFLQSHSQ